MAPGSGTRPCRDGGIGEHAGDAGADDRSPARAGAFNEMSGTVVGPSVQAGAIHGDVHFHEPAAPPVAPRQLLAEPAYFTNREQELTRLGAVAGGGARPPVAVLTGPGGVGKTALAMRWAHQVAAGFADGQLYVDLGGFSGTKPVDPGEVLGLFLRALGVAPARVPVRLAEQAALYRSVTAQRSLLVVLDNAYSAAQVRVLLPASPTSLVLVTSRSRLSGLVPEGADLIEVRPLPPAESVALLADALGQRRVAAELGDAEVVARLCGGLPIALCVAAARLASRPRLSIGRIAGELSGAQDRLRALSVAGGRPVQAAFDASYRSLEAPVAAAYRRLAWHPGSAFGPGPVGAVTAVTGVGSADAGEVVEALVEANLLEEVAEDRFRFHDLVRLHARGKAMSDDVAGERESAIRSMVEWYLAAALRADLVITPYRRRLQYTFGREPAVLPRFGDRQEALDWLEAERVNLIEAGRTAMVQGWPELAWHLCDVMWPLLLYRKHYRDRLDIDRRGIEAARAWGNAWAEADMLKRFSRVCLVTGDAAAAEEHIRASISLYDSIADRRGWADAIGGLASVYQDTGRIAQAIGLLRQVLDANRELGDDRATGLCLIGLAGLLTDQGQADEAVRLLTEARELFTALREVDPYNGVRVLTGLAGAWLETGELDRAAQAATEAVQGMRTLGSTFEQAEALDLLGRITAQRGEDRDAIEYWRQAWRIFASLGSSRAGEVRARLDLAAERIGIVVDTPHRAAGDPDDGPGAANDGEPPW